MTIAQFVWKKLIYSCGQTKLFFQIVISDESFQTLRMVQEMDPLFCKLVRGTLLDEEAKIMHIYLDQLTQ